MNFTQNLKLKQNEIDRFLSNRIKEREREINAFKFKLIKFIKIYNTRSSILFVREQEPIPEFKQILQLAKELVNENNSKLYFVYLPEYNRYIKTYDNKDFYLKMNDINLGETIVSNEGEVKVLGKKLETFLKDEGINKISVLKIDVEGNEEKILLPFLKDENKKLFPKTIIIEQNNDLWDGSLLNLLKEYGYNTYKKTRMNIILLKD